MLADGSVLGWMGNGVEGERSVEEQVWAVDSRAQFAREYLRRGGRDGKGEKLDPVLAAHLGLGEGE